jgi:hypothetical protein
MDRCVASPSHMLCARLEKAKVDVVCLGLSPLLGAFIADQYLGRSAHCSGPTQSMSWRIWC